MGSLISHFKRGGCDTHFECFVYFGYFVYPADFGHSQPNLLHSCVLCGGIRGVPDPPAGQGVHTGLSGGAGTASSMSARQEGGFFLPGPLKTRVGVDAQGQTGGEPVGGLGLQAGYEGKRQTFGQTEWALKPAAELEGIYIGQQSPVGDRPITPGVLGQQDVTLPMTVGVVLANAVFTVQTPWSSRIFPDLGVGAGVARLSIQGANSRTPASPASITSTQDPMRLQRPLPRNSRPA